MSSGEGAKPTSYEERNPFDISRRSGTEVAAEIAERLAAWKRARGRSYATPPAPGALHPSPASPAETKERPIAAPVQPARLPKYGEHAARAGMPANEPPSRPSGLPVPPRPAAEARVAGASASGPAASSATAVQRAMPPAPALRRPAAQTVRDDARADAPSGLLDAPTHKSADAGAAGTVGMPGDAVPDDALAGTPAAARSHAAEAAPPPAARAYGIAAQANPAPETPQMATASRGEASGRAEHAADAPKADGPALDHLGAEAAVQAPAPNPAASAASADQAVARAPAAWRIDAPVVPPSGLDRPGLDRYAPEAQTQAPAAPAPEAVGLDVRPAPARDPAMPRIDALAAEMHEAEIMARARSAAAASTPDGDAARAVPRKPLFDLRAGARQADAPARPETESVAHDVGRAPERADTTPAAAEPTGAAQDAASDQPGGSSLEALDREAYRIGSLKIEAPAAEPPAMDPHVAPAGEDSDRSRDQARSRGAETPAAAGRAGTAPAASGRRLRIAAPGRLTIEPPDPNARREPGGIELPSIETRIEARRIATLRADPWIAGRRPIFPRVEPEAWDIPAPAVASHAGRQRSGTGWAIGLGALLLIAGITAPAAIWQGRQAGPGDQDQVATLAPPPDSQAASQAASQVQPATTPAANPAPAASAPDQPQRAAATPPASRGSAPTPSPVASSPAPRIGSAAPEEETADRAAEQAALAPVRAGGELNEAPVTSPPPSSAATVRSPAGKAVAKAQPPVEPDPQFSPVPRAFVPEAAPKPTPFRPEPTPATAFQPEPSPATAVASVPANGASVAIDGSSESVALKPSLIGQLKPPAAAPANTADAAPRRAARKPGVAYPPTLDQMFQNLINTLSSGQPVNESSKPIPPSSRR